MVEIMNNSQQNKAIALILVSHSRPLAEAVSVLAGQMTGGKVPILCAAGAGDNGELIGTDAVKIMKSIESIQDAQNICILMDLGSALLSTDMALDLIDAGLKEKIKVLSCPFVEGAVAAAASAAAGASLDEVIQEAKNALNPKIDHLKEAHSENGEGASATGYTIEETDGEERVGEAAIPDPNGLHARPAAQLATLAGSFSSKIMIKNKTRNSKLVSARSLVALSSLGVKQNDILEVHASGDDAQKAVDAFISLISSLVGDTSTPKDIKKASQHEEASLGKAIPVSSGIVYADAFYLKSSLPPLPEGKADDAEKEKKKLEVAIKQARQELEHHAESDIISIQKTLLNDPELIDPAFEYIKKEQDWAPQAWHKSVEEAALLYEKLDDPYLKGRATDIRDLGLTVMRILLGGEKSELPKGKPYILIAEELPPSIAVQCDPNFVKGVVDRKGGKTSHSSIILRAASIPSIVGAAQQVPEEGVKKIGFDGDSGEIWVDPDPKLEATIIQKVKKWETEVKKAEEEAKSDMLLKDGSSVLMVANVSALPDAKAAQKAGAKGIGLLRTEILFSDRQTPPTEEEQIKALRDIFSLFPNMPLTVRTLDAGGDKPLPFITMPQEENPFLGERGVRLSLKNKDFFIVQLRALLRAGFGFDLKIMLPMVTDLIEFEETKKLLETAHEQLLKEKKEHIWPVSLGIMIEVPGAALQAPLLARSVDFFSIGTNDLTQYVLAAERGNPHLSQFADAIHPAVLQLIKTVVQAAHDEDKSVSVCGEAAGDPLAAALLLGLGVDTLSMGAGAFAKVRNFLRVKTRAECEEMVHIALKQPDASHVRKALSVIKR